MQNTDLLREYLVAFLSEESKYKKHTGVKFSLPQIEEIAQHASQHPSQYAFTMTNIPKIGVNPTTPYNTPMGVCFYPLTPDYLRHFFDQSLPSFGKRKYVNFVRLNFEQKKWLTFGQGLPDATREDLDHALKMCGNIVTNIHYGVNDINLIFKGAKTYGRHWHDGYRGKIYDVIWYALNPQMIEFKKPVGRTSVMWNTLLRKLGYIGLYDAGTGTLHPAEPDQVIALVPSAYSIVAEKWLGTYETEQLITAGVEQKHSAAGVEFEKMIIQNDIHDSKIRDLSGFYALKAWALIKDKNKCPDIHFGSLKITNNDDLPKSRKIPPGLNVKDLILTIEEGIQLSLPKKGRIKKLKGKLFTYSDLIIPRIGVGALEMDSILLFDTYSNSKVEFAQGSKLRLLLISGEVKCSIPSSTQLDTLYLVDATNVSIPDDLRVKKIYCTAFGGKDLLPKRLREIAVVDDPRSLIDAAYVRSNIG